VDLVVVDPAAAKAAQAEVEVKVVEVAADAHRAAAAKVVGVRAAVAAVDAHPAVVVDRVVEADVHPVVVAADKVVAVEGWEEAVVEVVVPLVEVGAEATVNSSRSNGASRFSGAPFFC